MGQGSSRYDSHRFQPPGANRYGPPHHGWSTQRRQKGRHPGVLSPHQEEEYFDDGYDYPQKTPRRRRPTYQTYQEEPEYQDEDDYNEFEVTPYPLYPSAQPSQIPFAPVQAPYFQPVIPNVQPTHIPTHGRSYATGPAVQMPVPEVPQAQPPQRSQYQAPPVIPHSVSMPVPAPTSAGGGIPYPGADAPIYPPGQPLHLPANPTSSSSSGAPRVQMPAPNVIPTQPASDRLAPGQYGPHNGGMRSPRSPDHRRTRSTTNHRSDDFYDRPRHRHSVDSNNSYFRRHRGNSPLRNPLPTPPKDIFERPELAELLTQLRLPPEAQALRRDPNAPTHALIIPHNGTARVERVIRQPLHQSQQVYASQHMRDRSAGGEKKKSGGLLRTLSNKLKPKHRDPRHIYRDDGGIPVQDILTTQPIVITADEQYLPPPVPTYFPPPPILESDAGQSQGSVPPPGQYGPPGGTPAGMPMRMPSPSPSSRSRGQAPPPRSSSRSSRPPPLQPTLQIDSRNEFADLLHFSQHPVHFSDKVYPSAYHLYEAFKFMEHRPDIAENIRRSGPGSEGIRNVGDIVHQFREHVRPDWQAVMVSMMEEALYHKFTQHDMVRSLLLATGSQSLLFSDAEDPFWGDGDGRGLNQLGQVLMRIRTRLRDAGYT